PSVGTYNALTGAWMVGTLASGDSATLTITATVLASGNYTNTATASASTPDPNTGNNTASVGTTPGPVADLTASKSSTPVPYVPGALLTYTITVSNGGRSEVPGAQVVDPLPAALAGFGWTCTATAPA